MGAQSCHSNDRQMLLRKKSRTINAVKVINDCNNDCKMHLRQKIVDTHDRTSSQRTFRQFYEPFLALFNVSTDAISKKQVRKNKNSIGDYQIINSSTYPIMPHV